MSFHLHLAEHGPRRSTKTAYGTRATLVMAGAAFCIALAADYVTTGGSMTRHILHELWLALVPS